MPRLRSPQLSPQRSVQTLHRPAFGFATQRGDLLRLAAVVVALVGLLVLPAKAAAEAPFRMATQIEDRAGVLGARQAEVQTALQTLQDTERVQLWVAYVDSFSGLSAQEWADQTATTSDLGLRDVLLAVAAGDRAYAYSVDQDFPLAQAELDNVMTVAVEPALSENDWAGAAIGAATGLGQALRGEAVTSPAIQPGSAYEPTPAPQPAGGGSSSTVSAIVGLVLLLVILAVVALVIWMLVRRARSRGAPGAAAGAAAAPPVAARERARLTSIQITSATTTRITSSRTAPTRADDEEDPPPDGWEAGAGS